jgi:hypothetical protein
MPGWPAATYGAVLPLEWCSGPLWLDVVLVRQLQSGQQGTTQQQQIECVSRLLSLRVAAAAVTPANLCWSFAKTLQHA